MQIYNPSEWKGHRNRTIDLNVYNDSLPQFLVDTLDESFKVIISKYKVPNPDDYLSDTTNHREYISMKQLSDAIDSGVTQCFLISDKYSPLINLNDLPVNNEVFYISGLIGVQIHKKFRGKHTRPTLRLVQTIRYRENENIRKDIVAYRSTFDKLEKASRVRRFTSQKK